jgi:hypothetical protein
LADQIVEPTKVHHTDFEQSENLLVSEEGELVDSNRENENEAEHLNGHSFEMEAEESSPDNFSEETTGDLPAQEATEGFIADETFVEGDEVEEAESAEDEIEEEADGAGSRDQSSDEQNEKNDSNDESAFDEDNDQDKEQ